MVDDGKCSLAGIFFFFLSILRITKGTEKLYVYNFCLDTCPSDLTWSVIVLRSDVADTDNILLIV